MLYNIFLANFRNVGCYVVMCWNKFENYYDTSFMTNIYIDTCKLLSYAALHSNLGTLV